MADRIGAAAKLPGAVTDNVTAEERLSHSAQSTGGICQNCQTADMDLVISL